MSTSGSTNYSITRSDIIYDALALLEVTGSDSTVAAPEDDALCARFLNRMVKHWLVMGLNLWLQQTATIFLNPNQNTYTLYNNAAADHAAVTSVTTTTTSAASLGASSVVVASVTGMTNGDNIGVVLDTGAIQWTTITNISTLTLTLNNTLTATAASGNKVYTFTTFLDKPLDILQATYKYSSGIEIPMRKISTEEYFNMPNKTNIGTSVMYAVLPGRTSTQVYLYPTPTNANDTMQIKFSRFSQDLDSTTDEPDFPIEWADALIYNLALRVAPIYGKEDKANKVIAPLAATFLQECSDWDNEHANMRFVHDGDFE
jgi:hypothetical protein